MNSIAKKMVQNLIVNIEFPVMVYSGKNGSVIAINEYGKGILGKNVKNLKTVVSDSTSMGLSKMILSYGNKIFYNISIFDGVEHFGIDAELNCIFIDNEYVIFCFFEKSYKKIFDKAHSKLVPRLFYKDKQHIFRNGSYYFTQDTNVILDGASDNQVFMDKPTCMHYQNVERRCMEQGECIYNAIHNITDIDNKDTFMKMNMVPLYDREKECLGVMGIYCLLLNREEHRAIFDSTLKENNILNQLIEAKAEFAVSWKLGGEMEVEYVSPNFTYFGYSLNDLYSGNIKWTDIVHPDDIKQIVQTTLDFTKDNSKKFLPMRYRIRKPSGRYIWVLDETYNVSKIGGTWHRQSVLKEISREELINET